MGSNIYITKDMFYEFLKLNIVESKFSGSIKEFWCGNYLLARYFLLFY